MLKDVSFHRKLVQGLNFLRSRNCAKQAFSLIKMMINDDDDIEAPWIPATYYHK
jgi:hypothetical protein